MTFRSAAVIGTGMMGPGIAATVALGGVETAIISRSADSARHGLATALSYVALLRSNGLAASAQAEWAQTHLSASGDLHAAVSEVDLVIESAPENLLFKQKLFAGLDAVARPDAVLASNTSGLSITAIAELCTRPQRVLTTHFWNPPHLMPLVEVVKGERTSHEIAVAVRDLLTRCGKVPVLVKKDRPGQLGNRLQMALVREAVNIVQEGIADAEDVDLAAKAGFGLRLPVYGILEHQDIVGLDLGCEVVDYVTRDLNNQPGAPSLMQQLLDEGKLGAKTGQGFYNWTTKSADEVRARRDAFILKMVRDYYPRLGS